MYKRMVTILMLATFRLLEADLTGMQQLNPPTAPVGVTGIMQNYVQGIQADKKPMIEPGVCQLGTTLTYKNDGKSIGMFDVAIKGDKFNWTSNVPSPTVKFGSSIKLVNKKDPKKAVFLGFVSGNRQSQVFRGEGEIACYLCSGSAAQDPNLRANPCVNPLDENYCVTCSPTPIACDTVITLQRAQSKGAEDRAQDATSIINRLGLTNSLLPVVNK